MGFRMHTPLTSVFRFSVKCVVFSMLFSFFSLAVAGEEDENWARFRGPNGEGKSQLTGVPTQWSTNDYEWKVDLPGKGHSSPIIWGQRLFLTTGSQDGLRTVLCLNAITGETIWTDSIQLEANHLHKKNSYASGTPTTDGKQVYVAFADEKQYTLLCYSLDGERIWSRDLGSFTSQHGQGVSPIIYNGKLIVPNDQMGPSRIVALDLNTGETIWESERDFRRTSYSTPMILNVNGQDQLICLSGALGLAGLDPESGKALWHSGELPLRTVASPVFGAGYLFAECGSGGRGKHMVAVDPSANGEVKQIRTQNLPYVPTPIFHNGLLFLWNDDGVVCCIDPQSDLTENIWRERVGGNYSGSPVLIDGKLYCISEEGEVVVVAADREFQLLGKNPLGDESYATPAVANGRVYFRGFHSLACLKATSTATVGQR